MTDPVEAIYQRHLQRRGDLAAHLPRLRALARDVDRVVELGVRDGASSSALILGARGRRSVTSYDLVETPAARELAHAANAAGDRWDYRIGDSRTVEPVGCDLLFIDTVHTFVQLNAELDRHAGHARRYLAFHDTITFGSVGGGPDGRPLWTFAKGQTCPDAALGIRPAIDRLMIRDPSWRIVAHHLDAHGLLVLERRS